MIVTLTCQNPGCGKKYVRNKTGRIPPWNTRKYCSPQCQTSAKQKIERAEEKKSFVTMAEDLEDDGKTPLVKLLSDKKFAGKIQIGTRLPIKVKDQTIGDLIGNSMEGKFLAGTYDIGGKSIYFRSKWEANYALYLEFLKKNGDIKEWEYEPEFFEFDKIRHGTTRYLPDFKITNKDDSSEYHEVKGYMDSRSKTKLKRMAKYYPHVKLILVDKDFYADLVKKVGKMLHFY